MAEVSRKSENPIIFSSKESNSFITCVGRVLKLYRKESALKAAKLYFIFNHRVYD